MSFFNDAMIRGFTTGEHPCPKCGANMAWEDELEITLICPSCGYDIDYEHYGFSSEEEYDALYPTLEEILEMEDEEE